MNQSARMMLLCFFFNAAYCVVTHPAERFVAVQLTVAPPHAQTQ